MNYKKILNNKPLIFIDKLFRNFGFYFEMIVDIKINKVISLKLKKLH